MSLVRSGTGVPAAGVAEATGAGVAVTAGDAGPDVVGGAPAGVALGRVVAGAAVAQPTNSIVTRDIAAIAR
jgi:hypothetical protein